MSIQQRPGRTEDSGPGGSRAAGPRYPGFLALFPIWTAVGVLTSARHFFLLPRFDLPLFLACVVYLYPWVVLTPVVFRLERRFPLGTGTWTRSLALLALWSVPMCLLASPVMVAIVVAITHALVEQAPSPRLDLLRFFAFVPVAEAMFWSSVAGGYAFRTHFELREQERRAARLALEKSQLEAGLNQAQLEVLRARLNPHFLFNSLQNISVMTGQDPQVASRMLARLGDLLRAVLRQDSRPETALRDEIELTRSYVALEQMRFADRLNVGFEIAAGTEEALVPCFLLQPLIENAITHGLRGVRRTGIITVAATAHAGELILTVTDNGIGPPPQDGDEMKVGVGLGSTCERLERMFPERHAFSMRRPAEGGAEVRIAIPLRFAAGEDRALAR